LAWGFFVFMPEGLQTSKPFSSNNRSLAWGFFVFMPEGLQTSKDFALFALGFENGESIFIKKIGVKKEVL
jgi:hypothetical protein